MEQAIEFSYIEKLNTMISGKEFAERCNWVVDPRYPERTQFSYLVARDKDWVFVNGDYVQTFLGLMPFLTTKRFYVVVHNSDLPFTEETLIKLRRYIYRVFAANTTLVHPRVTTIPLGFADNQLDFLRTFVPTTPERDIEVYLNIKLHHNWEKRGECIVAFNDDPRVVRRERVSVPEYYADLCRSKFVLCPEGTGIDTHRVYESILCGATPVVLRNSLSHLYAKFPVCIVDKWTDPFYVPPPTPVSWDTHTYLNES